MYNIARGNRVEWPASPGSCHPPAFHRRVLDCTVTSMVSRTSIVTVYIYTTPGRSAVGQPNDSLCTPTPHSAHPVRTATPKQETWFWNMHDSETFWNLFDSPSSLGSWLPHKASVRLIRLPFWEAGYLIWYSVAAYGNCLFSPSALSKRLNSNSQSHLPPLARTSLGRQ